MAPEGIENRPPRGLICPLVTPLKTGERLDEAALDRLIEHVGVGVDGLLVGDPFWGEGLVLGWETRLALYSAVLEIVQGRWPVFLTITAPKGKEARTLMAHTEAFADRLGYVGGLYWLDYPIYYHGNRGLPQWYASLAAETEKGFLLFNHAGLAEQRKRPLRHNNIRTSVLKKLAQLEGIKGLVFCGPLKRSMNYHRAVRDRRDFRFYDGDEFSFMTRPSADGVVAGGANLVPQVWRDIAWSCLHRFDVQQEYPDHGNQLVERAGMAQDLLVLYRDNPAGVMKRMLHVAGVLPNAGTAVSTKPSTGQQNRSVETLLARYDLA